MYSIWRRHPIDFGKVIEMKFVFNPITKRFIQNNSRNRVSIRNQIRNYQNKRLVLIACSKTKSFSGDEKIRASEAYCSPLFEKSRQWAISRGLDYAIISAKYGLVFPSEEIEDYDLMVTELSKARKKQWAEDIADRLPKSKRVISVLAGKSYSIPLRNALPESYVVEEPLEGLQVGERLSKLNKENLDWNNPNVPKWRVQ